VDKAGLSGRRVSRGRILRRVFFHRSRHGESRGERQVRGSPVLPRYGKQICPRRHERRRRRGFHPPLTTWEQLKDFYAVEAATQNPCPGPGGGGRHRHCSAAPARRLERHSNIDGDSSSAICCASCCGNQKGSGKTALPTGNGLTCAWPDETCCPGNYGGSGRAAAPAASRATHAPWGQRRRFCRRCPRWRRPGSKDAHSKTPTYRWARACSLVAPLSRSLWL
jgi:hypothetical protein